MCLCTPFAIACINICVHVQDSVDHVTVMDYGNTKAPGMHRRLGTATLLQLAFPGEIPLEQYSCKKKEKKEKKETATLINKPKKVFH